MVENVVVGLPICACPVVSPNAMGTETRSRERREAAKPSVRP
jgi:hypothetical protein